MPKQIELEFDGGRLFRADLLEKEAPETCAGVWDALPIEAELGHSIFNGQVLNVHLDQLRIRRVENPLVLGMVRGDVLVNTRLDNLNEPRGGYQQIRIVCGPAISFTSEVGFEPTNVFARIVEGNLDELSAIWREVHTKGMQRIRVRRVE